MRPSQVAEKFNFITGYAPDFREAAERLEAAAASAVAGEEAPA